MACTTRTRAINILEYIGLDITESGEYVTKEQCISMGADPSPLLKYISNKEIVELLDIIKKRVSTLIYYYEAANKHFLYPNYKTINVISNIVTSDNILLFSEQKYIHIAMGHRRFDNDVIAFAMSFSDTDKTTIPSTICTFSGLFYYNNIYYSFFSLGCNGNNNFISVGFYEGNSYHEVLTIPKNVTSNINLEVVFNLNTIDININFGIYSENRTITLTSFSLDVRVFIGACSSASTLSYNMRIDNDHSMSYKQIPA